MKVNVNKQRKLKIVEYIFKYRNTELLNILLQGTNISEKTLLNPDSWIPVSKTKDRDYTKKNRPQIGWVREYECGYGGRILGIVHTDINDKNIIDAYVDFI